MQLLFIMFLLGTTLWMPTATTAKECDNCVCNCDWTETYPCATAVSDGSCCFDCCCDDYPKNDIDCAELWTQCGGGSWTGATCCQSGLDCVYRNQWYSQCRPSSSQTPSPSSSQTPSPSSSQTPSPSSSQTPSPSCDCTCPPTSPTPSTDLPEYCPLKEDLMGGGTFDRGWAFTNPGGAGTRASFNLLGGYVEYDMDISGVNQGVNTNVYTFSPRWFPDSGYTREYYCDAQRPGDQWCVEIDFVESNGKCAGQTTLHTVKNTGSGCCHAGYIYDKTQVRMRIEITTDGQLTTFIDGERVSYFDHDPDSADLKALRDAYTIRGAIVYSSQWVGWVPNTGRCGGNGNASGSRYRVSNLKIKGSVVRGPIPTRC